jgi:hypothetical protein
MVKTHLEPIQIDEKRKYNRGRMLQGDDPASSEDSDVEVDNQRNHGNRIDDPRVFGLNTGKEKPVGEGESG